MREFSRAAERILARMGQDAFLRGTEPCRVHIARDVEVTGTYGEVVGKRDIATMLPIMAPKQGDALVIGAQSWIVDSPPFKDSGHLLKCVLRKP